MARPTISQRIALEGADEIKKALGDLGKAGEDAFAQLQKAGEKFNLGNPTAAIEQLGKRAGASIDDLRQRILGAGGAAAQSGSGIAAFGASVQSMQQRLYAAVQVGAQVGLTVKGIGSTFAGAIGQVKGFGDGVVASLQTLGTNVLKTVATLTAVPAAFVAIASSAANAASQIKEASIQAGTNPQEYQKLAIAAEQLGGSEERLVAALSLINQKVADQAQNFAGNRQRLLDLQDTIAKGGLAGEQAAKDYEALRREMQLFGPAFQEGGQSIINVEQALKSLNPSSRDAIERLKGIADEIHALPTDSERAARAVEIFGRRLGPQLVELLSGGSAAIDAIGGRAERLGLIMTNVELKLGKDLNDSLSLLRRSLAATKNSIGLLFAPAIIDAADLFTEAIGRNRTSLILWASDIATWVRPVLLDLVRALTGDVDAIQTGWIKSARQLIVDLGASIVNVVQNIAVPAFNALLVILQTVAEAINGIFGTHLTATDVGVILVLGKMIGVFGILASLLSTVGGAFGLLRGAFVAASAAGTVLAVAIEALSALFGVFAAAITGLVSTFGLVPIAIAAIGVALGFLAVWLLRTVDWAAFAQRARDAFDAIVAWASALWNGLAAIWQAGVDAIAGIWAALKASADAVWKAVADGAAAAWGAITSVWNAGINKLIGWLTALRDFAVQVWKTIADEASKVFSSGDAASGAAAYARGGPVYGAGTSTSNSIPAWLSSGEFVMRAAAVRKYGLSLFNALNRLRFEPDALMQSLQAMTPAPIRFAEGGLVPSTNAMRPINLTLGAETFAGLLAPEDVAQKLVRVAVSRQIRSAGRKPSFYGRSR